MGRNSSGVRGGFGDDLSMKFKAKDVRSLSEIKHNDVYREVKSAISRYHSVLGVKQKNVKLAPMKDNLNGVHVTSMGASSGIYLNTKVFNKKKSEIEKRVRKAYDSGWSTRTNKPIAHTVTHELAHATWNSNLKNPRAKAAGREIKKVYKDFMKNKQSGYGKYSRTNVDEFFAEAITKSVHGNNDKYSRKLRRIIKKYKL